MSRGIIFNQERQFVTLPDELKQALVQGAEPYPVPDGKQYEYGTAGVSHNLAVSMSNNNFVQFRMKA